MHIRSSSEQPSPYSLLNLRKAAQDALARTYQVDA